MTKAPDKPEETAADETPSGHDTPTAPDDKADRPAEIGGRNGPDPTRFGDWEKAGRCIDF